MKLLGWTIGFWDKKEPGIIWYENMPAGFCGCKFVTICNVLFVKIGPECDS